MTTRAGAVPALGRLHATSGLLLLSLLACSTDSDPDTNAAGAGAQGGGGAAAQSSSAATGGAGGSSATASSASTGGAGGAGGAVVCNQLECVDPPPGDRDAKNDCYSCSMGRGEACEADGDACAESPECPALIECENGCETTQCIVDCEHAYPYGLVLLSNLEFCVCYMGCATACAAECA